MANRLSQNPRNTVLLIEAGKPDNWLVRMPAGAMAIAYDKRFSWMHQTLASDAIAGRAMDWPRGKVLGGSSSTNGMVYVRGQAADYDAWADLGNSGWDWQSVLPYFKKLEDFHGGESAVHGAGGPVHVQLAESDELGDRFIKACRQAGIPATEDFNTGEQEGVAYYQVNIRNGVRQSAAESYLKPVVDRTNLSVLTSSMVERITFNGNTATGVVLRHNAKQRSIGANKEVLLCAGAVNSPQLLQVSGVGDAALLGDLGIPVVHNLLGVGQNLQDHLGITVACEVQEPITFKAQLAPHRFAKHIYRYLRYGKGLLSMPAGYVGAFFKSEPSLDRPDMQLHFNPASGVREAGGRARMDKVAGVTSIVTPMRPDSRGYIRIVSKDINQHPEINPNYLSTERDCAAMLSALSWQREIFSQSSMAEIAASEIRPGQELQSDEALLQYIQQWSITNYHPVGSCKMGDDPLAVVDSNLRVHGLNGLRVVDASIMPNLISGNTNAATMMIAEKVAAENWV